MAGGGAGGAAFGRWFQAIEASQTIVGRGAACPPPHPHVNYSNVLSFRRIPSHPVMAEGLPEHPTPALSLVLSSLAVDMTIPRPIGRLADAAAKRFPAL